MIVYPQPQTVELTMNPQGQGHLTRRTTLTALIASGFAGILARRQTADARQSVGKKAKKKCKKQEGQCVLALSPICEGDPACSAVIQQCCAFTARCDIPGFFTCTQQLN